jgi:hypothetical protein
VLNPDFTKNHQKLVSNPDLAESVRGGMPNPDLDQVPNPDFKASSKSGLDTRHKSLTRSSHLQVRVKNPAQVPNPDLVEGAKN